MGLLEAMSQVSAQRPAGAAGGLRHPDACAVVATHPIEGGGAIALVLEAGPGAGPTVRLQVVRESEGIPGAHPGEPAAVPSIGLSGLRETHPVGAALPLLTLLAGWQWCRSPRQAHSAGGATVRSAPGGAVAPNRPVALTSCRPLSFPADRRR